MQHAARPSGTALTIIGVGLALVGLTALHAATSGGAGIEARQRLATELQLTDFALFTEARYTRHPSQADLHSAFQDHPMALDHFPSGSFRAPPDFHNLHRRTDQDEQVD